MVVLTAVLVACGGSSKGEENYTKPDQDGIVRLVVNANDQMRYDRRQLRVKAGSRIELTLNHTGSLDKQAMGHNLVILKPGTDLYDFIDRANTSVKNDFIPEGNDIVVHTELIGGGESTTIAFDAPAPGAYDFICTFPGHGGIMKGTFTVL